jgi:hypothetical protein
LRVGRFQSCAVALVRHAREPHQTKREEGTKAPHLDEVVPRNDKTMIQRLRNLSPVVDQLGCTTTLRRCVLFVPSRLLSPLHHVWHRKARGRSRSWLICCGRTTATSREYRRKALMSQRTMTASASHHPETQKTCFVSVTPSIIKNVFSAIISVSTSANDSPPSI